MKNNFRARDALLEGLHIGYNGSSWIPQTYGMQPLLRKPAWA